jgi:hypothetical protein
MKVLLNFSLLILLLVNSLNLNAQKKGAKKVESFVFDPANNILVRYDEPTNKFKFAVKEEILKKSAFMADPRLATVDSVFISNFNTDRLYIVFHCTDMEQNSRKKAVLLRQLSNGIYKAAAEDKDIAVCLICEGVCCNECSFRMSAEGPLGCDCPKQCANANEEIIGYCNQVLGFKVAMIMSVLR